MTPFAISRDSPWTQSAWMQALDLGEFQFLSDWNGDAVRGFGVAHEFRGHAGRRRADGLPGRARRYGAPRMALRSRRGAGLRRAARGRAGLVALACALFVGGRLVRDVARRPGPWTRLPRRGHARLRRGGARRPPADELQLWLAGPPARARAGAVARSVQLPTRGRAARRTSPAGRSATSTGRSRLLSEPCSRGTCSSCSASSARAASTALWLREVGTPRGASLAGGLAFALAPYRQAQGARATCWRWISMLLPLSLYGARAGEARDRTGGSPSPAARSRRSRSRARCTSRSARSRSSPPTRSCDSPGPLWLAGGVAPRSAPGCSPMHSPCRGTTGASGRQFAAGRALLREPVDFLSRDTHAARRRRLPRLDGPGARGRRARSRSSFGAAGAWRSCSGSAR